MLFLTGGFDLKPKLRPLSTLVFKQIVTVLLLTNSHTGQSQEVGPSQKVMALVGDDVILPCHLEPAEDVVSQTVEWGRLDLDPMFVHVWYEGKDFLTNQNPSYRGRTSVSMDKLRYGDLSLTLSSVQHSDNGRYRCYFPSKDQISTVELLVGSFSSPVIPDVDQNPKGVTLQCESKGWYPKPELSWLDRDGNLLFAGPTETTKGPDGLYTVSRRVTVEIRASNSFTCRVHQNNITQSRETQIQVSVPDPEVTLTAARIIIVVVMILGVVFTVALVLWKRRQTRREGNQDQAENEEREKKRSEEEREEREDLEEKQKRLEEELKRNEEEEKKLEQVIQKLMEKNKEVKKQVEKIKEEEEERNKFTEEMEEKIQSAEKEKERDKGQGVFDMKSIILQAKKHLLRRKQEYNNLLQKTRDFRNITVDLENTVIDRKGAAESNKREVEEELEKIQRKLSEQRQKT